MRPKLRGLLAAIVIGVAGVALFALGGQQTINIGTNPNDGTGDPLRVAWQRANSNFTELYQTTTNILNGTNLNLRIANTNLVPAGATYNQTDLSSSSCTFITLNTNNWYFAVIPGQGNGNDIGVFWDTNSYLSSIGTDGLFRPTNAVVELIGETLNTTVKIQIYPVVTNLYGFLGGTFDGSLSTNASIPSSVVATSGAYMGGALFGMVPPGGGAHMLVNTNTINGSALFIVHAGNNGGYADINFALANSTNMSDLTINQKLFWAIGMGDSSAALIYQNPYIESYLNKYPIYYVGGGSIFGGFYNQTTTSADGDWIWFRNGTTSTPMFRINRASGTVSNNCNVTITSNLTVLQAIIGPGAIKATAQSATISATAIYTNNTGGTVYGMIEGGVEVTTTATGSIAPVFTATNTSSGSYTYTPSSVNTSSLGWTSFSQPLVVSNGTMITYVATLTGSGHYNINAAFHQWQ